MLCVVKNHVDEFAVRSTVPQGLDLVTSSVAVRAVGQGFSLAVLFFIHVKYATLKGCPT